MIPPTDSIPGIALRSLEMLTPAQAPSPVANRDFVNLRAWRKNESKGEYIICNHSVTHKDMPEKKNFVRCVIFCGEWPSACMLCAFLSVAIPASRDLACPDAFLAAPGRT